MSLSKKAIEKRFNIILDRCKSFDSGVSFWTAHKNEDGCLGDYVCDGYTLKEIFDSVVASNTNR